MNKQQLLQSISAKQVPVEGKPGLFVRQPTVGLINEFLAFHKMEDHEELANNPMASAWLLVRLLEDAQGNKLFEGGDEADLLSASLVEIKPLFDALSVATNPLKAGND